MKQLKRTFLIIMLMSMVRGNALAYDFEVKNADGVTIYYNKLSDTNVAVTCHYYSASYPSLRYTGNVVIPQSVTYKDKYDHPQTYEVSRIDNSAFSYCSDLTSVTIPNSMREIGDYAFRGCSSLTSVTIPYGVWKIGISVFSGCRELSSIKVESGNSYYDSRNNCNAIIYKGTNKLISGCKTTIIPNSVTSIGENAFNGCSGLTSITIPNSVTSIGENAFNGCSGLTSITIPNSVTSIGDKAFYDCSGLTSVILHCKKVDSWFSYKTSIKEVILGDEVTSIGDKAFYGCSGLTSITIPNSVTSIGYRAFEGCSSLTSVTIPNSVTSIGSGAFYGCSGLNKVRVPDIAAWCGISFYNSEANPLFYAHHLYSNEDTEITELIIPESVTSIGQYAFSGCSGLLSVVIPNNVTTIDGTTFKGCSGLRSLTLHCKEVGSWFSQLSNIQEITIGKEVTSIVNSAFSNCQLSSLTIGTGVMSIGSGCFNTKPIKTIWLTNTPPEGYTNAGGTINYVANNQYASLQNKTIYPFLSSLFDVEGVKYVPVSPSERTCDAIDCNYNETAADIHIGKTTSYKGIEMTVKEVKPYVCYENSFIQKVQMDNEGDIPDYAFQGCTGISTASIANQGIIGTSAFEGCNALTKASIKNVGDIGRQAFYNCAALKEIELGDSVTAIGQSAFENCTALQNVIIPDSVKTLDVAVFKNCSSLNNATIGKQVGAIGNQTFYGCSALANVQIGENVVTIGSEAFYGCSALSQIRIPQFVTNIGDNAFKSCNSIQELFIDNNTSQDNDVALSLGSNGSSPIFADCPLDSVYIGRNITYSTSSNKGYSPFYRNTSLRSVRISDKETEISENEFYGCTNLKNVYVGDGVTTIGKWAFSGCASLEYFDFGNSVESIGQEAFSDCISVTKIISHAIVPPACESQALDDINKWNCTLYVPVGALAAYKEAYQWKDFFFIEDVVSGVSSVVADKKPEQYFQLNGVYTNELKKGINIVRTNDGRTIKVVKK